MLFRQSGATISDVDASRTDVRYLLNRQHQVKNYVYRVLQALAEIFTWVKYTAGRLRTCKVVIVFLWILLLLLLFVPVYSTKVN
jgi:hypothetical protein